MITLPEVGDMLIYDENDMFIVDLISNVSVVNLRVVVSVIRSFNGKLAMHTRFDYVATYSYPSTKWTRFSSGKSR